MSVHLNDLDITEVKVAALKADDYTVVYKFNDQSKMRDGHAYKSDVSKDKRGGQQDPRSNSSSRTKIGIEGSNHRSDNDTNPKDENMWCDIHENKCIIPIIVDSQNTPKQNNKTQVGLIILPKNSAKPRSPTDIMNVCNNLNLQLGVSKVSTSKYGTKTMLGAIHKSNEIDPRLSTFINTGFVKLPPVDPQTKVAILRDTGCT